MHLASKHHGMYFVELSDIFVKQDDFFIDWIREGLRPIQVRGDPLTECMHP